MGICNTHCKNVLIGYCFLELSATVDMLTQFDDESIKNEIYAKMKKLGKELDSVKPNVLRT